MLVVLTNIKMWKTRISRKTPGQLILVILNKFKLNKFKTTKQ